MQTVNIGNIYESDTIDKRISHLLLHSINARD